MPYSRPLTVGSTLGWETAHRLVAGPGRVVGPGLADGRGLADGPGLVAGPGLAAGLGRAAGPGLGPLAGCRRSIRQRQIPPLPAGLTRIRYPHWVALVYCLAQGYPIDRVD